MLSDIQETKITSRIRSFPHLGEVWRGRHLAYLLTFRNIKARYAQTVMGIVWLVLQPLLLTGVVTLVIGIFLAAPTGGLPYAPFALAGIAMWTTFQRALIESSVSVVANSSIISKVYFPRLLAPVSSAMTALFDTLPIFGVLLFVLVATGNLAGWQFLLALPLLAWTTILAFSCGLILTVLDALIRDLRVVVPSLLQLVLYLSPVFYAGSAVPEKWQTVFRLNPLVSLLEGFRWAVIKGAPMPSAIGLLFTGVFTLFILLLGLVVFTRMESIAVDRM